MCDLRTFNRIEKAVEQRMATGQMFTAFDVTLDLQGKRVRKFHREIRRDIKRVADELMWRFGYERTLTRFAEIAAAAFVYHPYGTDAGLHRPSIRPRAIAPAKSRGRNYAAIDAMQMDADHNLRDVLFVSDELARAFGLSLAASPAITLNVVSGLVIVIKPGDTDIN